VWVLVIMGLTQLSVAVGGVQVAAAVVVVPVVAKTIFVGQLAKIGASTSVAQFKLLILTT
jgi:hypothetical protein